MKSIQPVGRLPGIVGGRRLREELVRVDEFALAGREIVVERDVAQFDHLIRRRTPGELGESRQVILARENYRLSRSDILQRTILTGLISTRFLARHSRDELDLLVLRCNSFARCVAEFIGADRDARAGTEGLAWQQDVVGLERAQRNDAADHARATDRRGGTFLDHDAADQFRIEIDGAHGIVARLLKILSRAVDHDVDAALLLQTPNIDRHARVLPVGGGVHARHVLEQIAGISWRALLDLLAGDHADRARRLVHPVRRALKALFCGSSEAGLGARGAVINLDCIEGLIGPLCEGLEPRTPTGRWREALASENFRRIPDPPLIRNTMRPPPLRGVARTDARAKPTALFLLLGGWLAVNGLLAG